jgi:hypothetical protein
MHERYIDRIDIENPKLQHGGGGGSGVTKRGAFCSAGHLEQSMGVRNRVRGIGLSYRPAKLQRLAESIPWNRFLGSKNTASDQKETDQRTTLDILSKACFTLQNKVLK